VKARLLGTKSCGLGAEAFRCPCGQLIVFGSKVGSLVDVDEATLNWEKVEYARLKVRTAVASKVQVCEEI